jgi:hypothetical protein
LSGCFAGTITRGFSGPFGGTTTNGVSGSFGGTTTRGFSDKENILAMFLNTHIGQEKRPGAVFSDMRNWLL